MEVDWEKHRKELKKLKANSLLVSFCVISSSVGHCSTHCIYSKAQCHTPLWKRALRTILCPPNPPALCPYHPPPLVLPPSSPSACWLCRPLLWVFKPLDVCCRKIPAELIAEESNRRCWILVEVCVKVSVLQKSKQIRARKQIWPHFLYSSSVWCSR